MNSEPLRYVACFYDINDLNDFVTKKNAMIHKLALTRFTRYCIVYHLVPTPSEEKEKEKEKFQK